MSPRSRHKSVFVNTLAEKFPPSAPCSCPVCVAYCARPGWWTVEQASQVLHSGYTHRIMLELSPDRSFGVLSPAFKGCESNFALDIYSQTGCAFLNDGLCELYATGFQPLECRHCHHADLSAGPRCHAALESDWRTPAGQALVLQWGHLTGLWERVDQIKGNKK